MSDDEDNARMRDADSDKGDDAPAREGSPAPSGDKSPRGEDRSRSQSSPRRDGGDSGDDRSPRPAKSASRSRSPRIIVEGDKENKMAGLTELRKEVIMDMEDFAQNEVSAADTPPASIHAPRGDATPSIFSPTLTWPVGRRPESSSCKKNGAGLAGGRGGARR